MRRALILLPLLATACQSNSSLPLLPRNRALYTTFSIYEAEAGPAEIAIPEEICVVQIDTLARLRKSVVTPLESRPGTTVEIELRPDRNDDWSYQGKVRLTYLKDLNGAQKSWTESFRLPLRMSGRWTIDLGPNSLNQKHVLIEVEMEPDPYYEMNRQAPIRY
jgi:hypothetical protein